MWRRRQSSAVCGAAIASGVPSADATAHTGALHKSLRSAVARLESQANTFSASVAIAAKSGMQRNAPAHEVTCALAPVLLGIASSLLALGCCRAGRRRQQRASAMMRRDDRSLLGSYLAGRVARGQNDTTAAATYYGRRCEHDPGNEVLIEHAFLMEASEGNWPRVEELAARARAGQPAHRTARAFLGLAAFKAGRYAGGRGAFQGDASANPIGELTSTLARAWIYQAQNKTQEALAILDSPKLPEWANYFLRYPSRADRRCCRPHGRRARRLRAHRPRTTSARCASRWPTRARLRPMPATRKLAQSMLKAHVERTKGDAASLRARAAASRSRPASGRSCSSRTPAEGMAEVFYGLGEALSAKAASASASSSCSSALYLTPDCAVPARDAGQRPARRRKRYAAAIAAYDRIPKGTPLEVNIEIRKALNLNQLERVDEAKRAAGRSSRANIRRTSVRSRRWAASCAATSAMRRPSTTTRAPSR